VKKLPAHENTGF